MNCKLRLGKGICSTNAIDSTMTLTVIVPQTFSLGSKAGQNILAGPGPVRLKLEAGAPS